MSNPVFNESRLEASRSGWASSSDGMSPVQRTDVFTSKGAFTAALALMVLLLVSGTFGWFSATTENVSDATQTVVWPPLATGGLVVGFLAALVAAFKPNLAKILGPVYALCYGYAVGAVSASYNAAYEGIVLQAVLATVAVLVTMLVVYRTGIVKVTGRFRQIVFFATAGVMVMYLGTFVASLFGAQATFLSSPSPLGIALSVGLAGLAAANLLLDFDFIDRAEQMELPKNYEWAAALGLVTTLVWLYLELLKLMSKLRS